MKLTRYLLRVTREGKYGDSMERIMYNTVLGALPIKRDGSTFYYSDYNYKGTRVYHDGLWACCSGTLPQVAADYGINSYLQEPGAIWVNLYIPSTLRWKDGANHLELTQTGTYPYSEAVEFRLKATRPATFALHLRIPSWADGSRIAVNGRQVPVEADKGFAVVQRMWRDGDVVELELPKLFHVEQFDPTHPEVVALMYGPMVLFAITDEQPRLTRKQVLNARRTGNAQWTIDTDGDPLQLVPFTEVGDAQYTTYLKLS